MKYERTLLKILSKSSQVNCAGLLQARQSIQRKSTTFYCKYIYTAVKRRSSFNQREWKCWQKYSSKSPVWCYYSFTVWPKKHQPSAVIRLSSQEKAKKKKPDPKDDVCKQLVTTNIHCMLHCASTLSLSKSYDVSEWKKQSGAESLCLYGVKVGVDGWVHRTFGKPCAFWTSNPDIPITWLRSFYSNHNAKVLHFTFLAPAASPRFSHKPNVCFVPTHDKRRYLLLLLIRAGGKNDGCSGWRTYRL